jgi:hypothetical protein
MTLTELMNLYDNLVLPEHQAGLGESDELTDVLSNEECLVIPADMTKSGKGEKIVINE